MSSIRCATSRRRKPHRPDRADVGREPRSLERRLRVFVLVAVQHAGEPLARDVNIVRIVLALLAPDELGIRLKLFPAFGLRFRTRLLAGVTQRARCSVHIAYEFRRVSKRARASAWHEQEPPDRLFAPARARARRRARRRRDGDDANTAEQEQKEKRHRFTRTLECAP
jgi:hypothetical protein